MAWDLISLLPTNSAMEKKIQHFYVNTEGVNWNELVNPKSTFSLLYSLRIIKASLTADEASFDTSVPSPSSKIPPISLLFLT